MRALRSRSAAAEGCRLRRGCYAVIDSHLGRGQALTFADCSQPSVVLDLDPQRPSEQRRADIGVHRDRYLHDFLRIEEFLERGEGRVVDVAAGGLVDVGWLRALSNIAFRSGSVEFSCTAGTRATGPSAREGIANAATIVTRTETGSDRSAGLFIASFLSLGPVQGRNPLGLRFLRRFRLART